MITGEQHREARLALGYTQAAWGQEVGVSRWAVMDWEGGRSPVPGAIELLLMQRLSEAGAGEGEVKPKARKPLRPVAGDPHEACEVEMARLRGVLVAVAAAAEAALASTLTVFETKRARETLDEIVQTARAAATRSEP